MRENTIVVFISNVGLSKKEENNVVISNMSKKEEDKYILLTKRVIMLSLPSSPIYFLNCNNIFSMVSIFLEERNIIIFVITSSIYSGRHNIDCLCSN